MSSQFWRLKSKISLVWLKSRCRQHHAPTKGLRDNLVSPLSAPVVAGTPAAMSHLLPPGHLLISLLYLHVALCDKASSATTYKDTWDCMQGLTHSGYLIMSAKTLLLALKVLYSQGPGIRTWLSLFPPTTPTWYRDRVFLEALESVTLIILALTVIIHQRQFSFLNPSGFLSRFNKILK